MSTSTTSQRYTGKTVVVTGGGGGIGRAMCHAFAAEGAFVVAADLNLDAAQETINGLPVGTKGLAVLLDVTDPKSWAALTADLTDKRRGCDILCNNAGVMTVGSVEQSSLSDWELQSRVNVGGVILGCQAFLPLIRATGGTFLNTASLAGMHPWPNAAYYAASKYAVVGFSDTFRIEAGDNVNVCVLCPGGIETAMTAQLEDDDGERLMVPADVADLVLDAVAERRSYVFTHPEYLPMLQAYHGAVADDYQKIC